MRTMIIIIQFMKIIIKINLWLYLQIYIEKGTILFEKKIYDDND